MIHFVTDSALLWAAATLLVVTLIAVLPLTLVVSFRALSDIKDAFLLMLSRLVLDASPLGLQAWLFSTSSGLFLIFVASVASLVWDTFTVYIWVLLGVSNGTVDPFSIAGRMVGGLLAVAYSIKTFRMATRIKK